MSSIGGGAWKLDFLLGVMTAEAMVKRGVADSARRSRSLPPMKLVVIGTCLTGCPSTACSKILNQNRIISQHHEQLQKQKPHSQKSWSLPQGYRPGLTFWSF